MPLYIMRHGEAATTAVSDFKRPLTDRGREEVSETISEKKDDLLTVDEIWVSPLLRAQQTALLVNEQLEKPMSTHTWLHPGGNPKIVIDAVLNIEQKVLIVSHQPLVGILVDMLIGAEPGRYRLTTAALARIDADIYAAGCCDLHWLHQHIPVSQ